MTLFTVYAREKEVVFSGQVSRHHWGFDGPAHAKGTEEEQMVVFHRVRDKIVRVFRAYAAGLRDIPL